MNREGAQQTNVYGRARAAVGAATGLVETEPHNDAVGTPPPSSKKSTNPTGEGPSRALKGTLQSEFLSLNMFA